MIHEFRSPVPCKTPLGDGYIWYVTNGGYLENDEYTVILTLDGSVRHFVSDQITIWSNGTYGINNGPSTPFEL